MDEYFWDMVRREAANASGGREFKGSLAVTGYDEKTHAVKGILLPSEVETGWVPLASMSAGDGYGVMAGPNVGSADKLDGDIMDVEFENGDANTPIAKHKHFSNADNPPEVKSGELLIKHQTGGATHFKADGAIKTSHKDGGYDEYDKDGHHTHDTNNKNIVVKSGTGSQSFDAQNINLKGAIGIDGDITQNGSHVASGQINGAGGVLSGGLPVSTA